MCKGFKTSKAVLFISYYFFLTTKTCVLRITIVFYCSLVSPLNKLIRHLCFYSWFSPSPNPRIKTQQVHSVLSTLIEPINPNFTFNKLTHQDSKLGMNLQVQSVCARAMPTLKRRERIDNGKWKKTVLAENEEGKERKEKEMVLMGSGANIQ